MNIRKLGLLAGGIAIVATSGAWAMDHKAEVELGKAAVHLLFAAQHQVGKPRVALAAVVVVGGAALGRANVLKALHLLDRLCPRVDHNLCERRGVDSVRTQQWAMR